MSYKIGLFTLIGVVLLIGLLYILPTIATLLWYFALFLLIGLALSLVIYVALAGLMAREKLLIQQAERKAKEFQAHVISTEHGTWFIAHKDIDIAPLHNTPYLRINGHERELTPDERFYSTLQVPHNRAGEAVGLLPAGQPIEPQLDLLNIFTQPTQSYAIIGGQQAGKTYQARRIASYWQQTGLKPIVIGPKWDRGEWAGCELFGGEYNFERVAQGMRIIGKLAQSRHADTTHGHKDHPIQPVFFDDWTAIRAKLESEAEAFILDATTLYASVNIILYFIIHLDTANAWGVGKVGAALHRNFYKLLIELGTDPSGLIDRSQNRGFILYPGMSAKDKKPVRLFSGTGQAALLPNSEPVIFRPTEQEQRLITLAEQGASYNEMARQVFGSSGGMQTKQIKEILAKFGM